MELTSSERLVLPVWNYANRQRLLESTARVVVIHDSDLVAHLNHNLAVEEVFVSSPLRHPDDAAAVIRCLATLPFLRKASVLLFPLPGVAQPPPEDVAEAVAGLRHKCPDLAAIELNFGSPPNDDGAVPVGEPTPGGAESRAQPALESLDRSRL